MIHEGIEKLSESALRVFAGLPAAGLKGFCLEDGLQAALLFTCTHNACVISGRQAMASRSAAAACLSRIT